MKRLFSKYAAAALCVVTTLLLAACSSGSGSGDGPDNPGGGQGGEFEGIDADVLVEAVYRSDNSAGAGNYIMVIANGEPAADGDPANVGEFQMQLDLYNDPDSDPVNAALPAGTYEMKADMSAFTWNPQHSALYIRTDAGDDGVTVSPMIGGKVTVSRSGMNYTVIADMVLMTGEELTVRYIGAIPFVQGGTSAYERFQTPQDITFEYLQGRFYANWFYPHADDMNVEMFSGKFDDNGNLTDGYYMTLPVYMPKVDYPEKVQPQFIDGTYRIVSTPGSSVYNIPYTITQGDYLEIFGMLTEVGAYVKLLDSKTGKCTIGILADGTVDVRSSGSDYTVTLDATTTEGVSIKGSYSGPMTARNFCNNASMKPRPWSTLTENYTLSLPATTIAGAFLMGDYIVPGLDSWIIMVMNEDGDMVTTELLVPAGKGLTLPVGTFSVSNSLDANTAIAGFQAYGGDILYTWYGDLGSTDSEGYQTRLAPISGGSITIEKVGEQYKFTFDLTDDARHRIDGQWTGAVDMLDYTANSASVNRLLRK